MILDTTIEVYSFTSATGSGSEGIPSKTYSLAFTSLASVQPVALTDAQLKQWGISTIGTDAKRVFLPGAPTVGQSWGIKDLKNGNTFQVRGTNPWPRHLELIAEPFQGVSPI